jgi:hypothetical protein
VNAPPLDQDLSFSQAVEDFAVEQFVSETVIVRALGVISAPSTV